MEDVLKRSRFTLCSFGRWPRAQLLETYSRKAPNRGLAGSLAYVKTTQYHYEGTFHPASFPLKALGPEKY